jgi:hypothetical protein
MLSDHVDDQQIAGNNLDELTESKRQLNDAFECPDAGPVGYFLGFNIYRDRPNKRLYISQEHYFEALLEKYGMADCNPARTPLPSGFRPVAATEEEFAEAKALLFPQIAGALLYAATINDRTYLLLRLFSADSSPSGTSPTAKRQTTSPDTYVAPPTSHSHTTRRQASVSYSDTQMQTGEVASTSNSEIGLITDDSDHA